jgi:hypothetical protein
MHQVFVILQANNLISKQLGLEEWAYCNIHIMNKKHSYRNETALAQNSVKERRLDAEQ